MIAMNNSLIYILHFSAKMWNDIICALHFIHQSHRHHGNDSLPNGIPLFVVSPNCISIVYVSSELVSEEVASIACATYSFSK